MEWEIKDDQNRIDEILKDIKRRDLLISGILAVNQDGDYQIICYGSKGEAAIVSQKASMIGMYSKSFDSNAMRALGDFYSPVAYKKWEENKKKENEEAVYQNSLNAIKKKSSKKKSGFLKWLFPKREKQ
jgi:hypothetical protein